jgi:hypothetical protein
LADVDPFVIKLTKENLTEPATLFYLNRFLHDLWIRTGGGNDDIGDSGIKELYSWQGLQSKDELLNISFPATKDQSAFDVVEVTGTTHTTAGNEIVICNNTSKLTVTLNANPDHKERAIIVRNNTGKVDVTTPALINGKTIKTILRRYTAIDHIFTSDAASWNVI